MMRQINGATLFMAYPKREKINKKKKMFLFYVLSLTLFSVYYTYDIISCPLFSQTTSGDCGLDFLRAHDNLLHPKLEGIFMAKWCPSRGRANTYGQGKTKHQTES